MERFQEKSSFVFSLIDKYYDAFPKAKTILLQHSFLVAKKALSMSLNNKKICVDEQFVFEAAMLHDIGIFLTKAPDLGCNGEFSYICHGFLGADLLRQEGLERHALVCERHTGVGLSIEDIKRQQLPVPQRDMRPISVEEQLICFADKFFSKTNPTKEKSFEEVKLSLARFGEYTQVRLNDWNVLFNS